MIESEYQAMASEITRIANQTNFNTVKLLDGTLTGAHNGTNLQSKGAMKIHFGPANSSAEDYYYIEIGNSTASALGVGNAGDDMRAGYSISTQSAAQNALDAINSAIISKDKIRASLGAIQNRLQNTVTNLSIQAENLQAAESRISDVDVASEMTEFVRNQILSQAAVSMLVQANALPRMALNLIG
ncbi:MAG: flagellin, partial [Deltaproteobacteria bacterium]|jgi:flagellin|nr:flagellin [Deltaproteobacteria bacterium]